MERLRWIRELCLDPQVADAINLGLTKMAEACTGMTFNRLAWVVDWHVRDETYTKALAEIINYHHRVPLRPTGETVPRPRLTVSALRLEEDQKAPHRSICSMGPSQG